MRIVNPPLPRTAAGRRARVPYPAVSTRAPEIVVTWESGDPAARDRAAALADALGLPLAAADEARKAGLRLAVTDARLELASRGMKSGAGAAVDFSAIDTRPGRGVSKRHPLARAVGRDAHSVLDATAGMGQDAFLLACIGFRVTAVECSLVIAALLEDGLRRAELDERLRRAIGGRLRIIAADAREVIRTLTEPPDAIYIDPMFPPKRRESALPRKEIQLIRRLAGNDPDAGELLSAALESGAKRVVVKRPHHAQPLGATPDASIESKLVRYDLYFP
jgi:16S rRNA (guanine1516-N2)-methyltransferase